MIELFVGEQPLKIKSNIDMKVGAVERFNSDSNIDMDLVTLSRILYPKNILSTGTKSTVADRSLARAEGLYFSKGFGVMDLVDLIKKDPTALQVVNRDLAYVERDFARIMKNRSPLKINPRAYRNLIDQKTAKREDLISKWQPMFTADISQKTDPLRLELSEKYGIDPKSISKESIATKDMSIEDKSDLFEIMDIFNIQQEISNLSKLDGNPEYSFSFIPFGSVSGRSSTFGENIHGLTKEQFGMFTKKQNGMRLVSIDFSQVELRLAASLWGDFAMQNVFNTGGDIHLNTARLIDHFDRQLAKALNFGLLYGMGVESFLIYCAKDFGIMLTYDQAKKYVEEFKRSYPSLFDKKVTDFTGMSYKTKTLGREMHAQEVFGGAYDMKKYTISRNIQIQGEGADIEKKSIIQLAKMLEGAESIAFEFYDEIGFWIKDDSNMNYRLNAICDDLTSYIKDFSGFSIPVQISDRF